MLPMMNRKTPNVRLFLRPHHSAVYAPDQAPRRLPILIKETRSEMMIDWKALSPGGPWPKRLMKSGKSWIPEIWPVSTAIAIRSMLLSAALS